MSKSRERIKLRWNIHEKNAPRSSDRWAASDRGWLFADIVPSPMTIDVRGTTYVCLGHYLDYETPDQGRESHADKLVHAVSCVTRESRYFATPADAQAWLMAQAKGRIPEHFASCHNGYEWRKDQIRKLEVQP